MANRTVRPTRKTALTPGQKAAATKRANGLDLAAVAQKALATRLANLAAAAAAARKAVRQARKTAR